MNKGQFKKGHVPWNKGVKVFGTYYLPHVLEEINKSFLPRKNQTYKRLDKSKKWWQFWKPKYKTFFRYQRGQSPKFSRLNKVVKFSRYGSLASSEQPKQETK